MNRNRYTPNLAWADEADSAYEESKMALPRCPKCRREMEHWHSERGWYCWYCEVNNERSD